MTEPTEPARNADEPVDTQSFSEEPGSAAGPTPGELPAEPVVAPWQAVPVEPAQPPARPVNRLALAAIAAGVLAVAVIITTVMWLTAKGDLTDTRSELADTQNQLSSAQEQIAGYEAASAAAEAEANDVPDLKAVADEYFTNIDGDSDSVRIKIGSYDMVDLEDTLSDMLDELGFSSAVLERMQATRALDGTLTAEGHNCNVSWTYHPDNGLNMVFEVENP